jgi:hypothetical protein
MLLQQAAWLLIKKEFVTICGAPMLCQNATKSRHPILWGVNNNDVPNVV